MTFFSGTGTAGSDGSTNSTTWATINHMTTIGGVARVGVPYSNNTGRTQTVAARVMCSIGTDGAHVGWFRLNASGTGVSILKQGAVRTQSGNYLPASLEILLTVPTGTTVVIFLEAEVASGGTAYLCETGDAIWTMIGQAIG